MRPWGKIFQLLAALFLGCCGVNFLWLLRRQALPSIPTCVHLLLAVSIVAFVAVSLLELFRYRNREVAELLAGVTVLAVLSATDLVRFYLPVGRSKTSMTSLGLFLFLLLLAFGTLRRVFVSFSRARSFEAIAGAIPTGIFRAKNDRHLTITYANNSYYRIYGYPSEKEAKRAGLLYADFATDTAEAQSLHQLRNQHIAAGACRFEVETREHDCHGNEIWVLTHLDYQPESDELFGSMMNITDRKAMEEQLRISEEEYRIAVAQSDKYILRYEIKSKTLHQQRSAAALFGIEEQVENVPESVLALGIVAPESIESYRNFYGAMQQGQPTGRATLRMLSAPTQEFCWYQGVFTTIFDSLGNPLHSIISFSDITQQREKELAYERMLQELANVPPQKYTTFDCDLTRDTMDRVAGQLLPDLEQDRGLTFNQRTAQRIVFVHPKDRQKFSTFMERGRLLEDFDRGVYRQELDYRRIITGGDYQWLRITVQLVRYPDSCEIKAFVAVRDIDEAKRRDLALRELSQTDALTHALNRAAFAEKVDLLLQGCSESTLHAFVMIDLDNFKQVNDTFGHLEGDRILTSTVQNLRSLLREEDLIGRIGGDEFMICLPNVPNDCTVEKRARQICRAISTQSPGPCSCISGSAGIALYPRDGQCFEELYSKADGAMYRAKELGKSQYLFYSPKPHED